MKLQITFDEMSDALAALPEVIQAQQLVENNDWHDDTVYEQAVRLCAWVRSLPGALTAEMAAPAAAVSGWLDRRVDNGPRGYGVQQLLAFAALIHDLGKGETLEQLPDGTTRCPGHEAVSARLAAALCARFDFSERETTFVVSLVAAHGQPYALYKQAAALPDAARWQTMRAFAAEQGALWPALLIFACGDLMTSHMPQRNPARYQAVLAFYQAWLAGVPGGVG